MLTPLMRLLFAWWRPLGGGGDGGRGSGRQGREGLLWYRDLGRCAAGDFSMAVVQADEVLEDQSQIESGLFVTFVEVYNGHEKSLLSHQMWQPRGHVVLLVSLAKGLSRFADSSDSRVVLGRKIGNIGEIAAIRLSPEHNANMEDVRQELKAQHPNNPQIVVLKYGVWRIKGIIQVSKSIGDAYMKYAQYNREPINAKFRISEPMNMPILSVNPSIITHHLQPSDSFLIFASVGLWEHLGNQQAIEIVRSHSHSGSAKRLIKAALREAARK